MKKQCFLPGDRIVDSYRRQRGEVVFVEPLNYGDNRKVWYRVDNPKIILEKEDDDITTIEHGYVEFEDITVVRRRRFETWFDEYASTQTFETTEMVDILFDAFQKGCESGIV